MGKKKEFKELMDEILNSVSGSSKKEIPLLTKNVLKMLMNLRQQIEDQGEQLDKVKEGLRKTEKKFMLLIKELQRAGYINLGERRKIVKRNIITQEAFINLLKKKGLINRKELLEEIKKLTG